MRQASPAFTARAAQLIRRSITAAVIVIASLSFAFGFGNGWQLGRSLGVAAWIAPLVSPAVDLSVIALLSALHYLRAQGIGGRLVGPRLLLTFCGLMTFGLNTAHAIVMRRPGLACFDALSPLLLIGWSDVGPRLLALLHQLPTSTGTGTGQRGRSQDGPGPSLELLAKAHRLDQEHRQRTGRPIPRDQLRAALRVSNATAGELLQAVRQAADSPQHRVDHSAL
jgi:hypothetical protein